MRSASATGSGSSATSAGCDGCTAYLDQMRLMLRLAGRIAPESIDPVFRERLMEAFRGWSGGALTPGGPARGLPE